MGGRSPSEWVGALRRNGARGDPLWYRGVAAVLVGAALYVALTPAYHLPRRDPLPRPSLYGADVPTPLVPLQEVAAEGLHFAWRWEGEPLPWRVEVRDAGGRLIVAESVGVGTSWHPPAEVVARFATGSELCWQVIGQAGGGERRSAALAFRVQP